MILHQILWPLKDFANHCLLRPVLAFVALTGEQAVVGGGGVLEKVNLSEP